MSPQSRDITCYRYPKAIYRINVIQWKFMLKGTYLDMFGILPAVFFFSLKLQNDTDSFLETSGYDNRTDTGRLSTADSTISFFTKFRVRARSWRKTNYYAAYCLGIFLSKQYCPLIQILCKPIQSSYNQKLCKLLNITTCSGTGSHSPSQ